MFNALKYIRSLENVGFKREQAEAQVQLVMDTYEENVATKADLAELRAEIKSDLAGLSGLFVKFMTLVIGAITLATGILGFLIKS